MLKARRQAAEQVAALLFETETAIDAAVSKAAELAAKMPVVRQDANLSALIGQSALEKTIATLTALADARSNIVATHKELSIAQQDIGLGAVSYGGSIKPPPSAHRGPLISEVA
ncbi:MAG: hypothetical protein ACK41P_07780 [Asticcacaulis sp.]